jgi:hypothetical protein
LIRRASADSATAPSSKPMIQTAQMGDLVLDRCLGRDTTIATLLPHSNREAGKNAGSAGCGSSIAVREATGRISVLTIPV